MLQNNLHPLSDYELIGTVGKPHGLKGSFFIAKTCRNLGTSYKTLRIGAALEAAQVFSVEIKADNELLVRLKGNFDRSTIEAMAGLSIWAIKSELVGFQFSNLLGLSIKDADDQELGKIQQFFNYGASDTVAISSPELGVLELPFVAAYFQDFARILQETPLEIQLQPTFQASDFIELWSKST